MYLCCSAWLCNSSILEYNQSRYPKYQPSHRFELIYKVDSGRWRQHHLYHLGRRMGPRFVLLMTQPGCRAQVVALGYKRGSEGRFVPRLAHWLAHTSSRSVGKILVPFPVSVIMKYASGSGFSRLLKIARLQIQPMLDDALLAGLRS